MTPEHSIQNDIRNNTADIALLFRANVGSGITYDGRHFDTGLPKGFSDLFGFRYSDGRIVFIEVKGPNGITERLKSEQKRWEKKAADEKAEAERVAKMSADEKAKHEQEKREREFAEREAALARKERTATARDLLAEKGLPASLIGAVDVSSDETVQPSVDALAKAFADAVSAEVTKKLAGAPPKTGSPAKSDPFHEGLGI